ncbi:hypothetical protein P7K49_013072 [Saguinus oedipus]|uniref:Uncharacterized protein n=1 Tax=Saguinus oedipus TaxID=9490 RepID=A0ABQ9VF88_SAGOE|nr:hypothetical protein P7K49_013072 [Saguinus oedipus]
MTARGSAASSPALPGEPPPIPCQLPTPRQPGSATGRYFWAPEAPGRSTGSQVFMGLPKAEAPAPGEWQLCSSSCGPGGLSRRAVLCIRSVGLDEQSALEPPACEHLPQPPAATPCNRHVPCPATWAVGNWSQVSAGWEGPPPAPPLVSGYSEADSLPPALTAWYRGWEESGAFQGPASDSKASGIRKPLRSHGHSHDLELGRAREGWLGSLPL